MISEIFLATATPMEMAAVLKGLDLAASLPEPGGYCSVKHNGRRIRTLTTGVGPLAAAHAAGRLAGEGLLAPNRCRGVVLFGIAGTYAPQTAPIGAVVLASKEIWPEYGVVFQNGVDPVALGFPLAGRKEDANPPPVWNALDLAPEKTLRDMGLRDAEAWAQNGLLVASGPSVTVAGVSGTPERAEELTAQYAALTENMEGFPLALAALQVNVPFVEARAVSNIAGNRSPTAWDIPASLETLAKTAAAVFA